ncbi:MAG: DUF6507 family protein [Micrococcus sp.]|nr:DUF6507 family protein [Micrococcus sp.]
MTEYWINLGECQRVVNELRGLFDTVRTDFDKIPENMAGVRRSLCAYQESDVMEGDTGVLDAALRDFVDDKLSGHFDDIVATIELRVNSMQEVINHYAFGDAEMAATAQGKTDELPDFVYTDAAGNPQVHDSPPRYTAGHPATGLVGHPGQDTAASPVNPALGDPTELLTEDVHTEKPFEFVTVHPAGNDSDGK